VVVAVAEGDGRADAGASRVSKIEGF
jgi:hypothetical protein